MPFSRFLSTYYDIQVEEKIWLDNNEGYRQGSSSYFIIPMNKKEIFYMEQAAISYFFVEKGYQHMAKPIPNREEKWFTPYYDNYYMVLKVEGFQRSDVKSEGKLLANFHHEGTGYEYQPKEISSYGQWKKLWIDKVTIFEAKIEEEAKKVPSDYYRLLMDTLPYFIGISENAIQYVRESETETRFSTSDQGTICFHRYRDQLLKPMLWPEDLVYDHPARDIAEYIRPLLYKPDQFEQVIDFLDDYQSEQILSIFSFRLIFSRLLFPTSFYDFVYSNFNQEDKDERELNQFIEKQVLYEKGLHLFYDQFGLNEESLNLPMIHWL